MKYGFEESTRSLSPQCHTEINIFQTIEHYMVLLFMISVLALSVGRIAKLHWRVFKIVCLNLIFWPYFICFLTHALSAVYCILKYRTF